jgi:hypothetical protein
MPVLTPDLFYLTAQEMLDCVCDALALESECGCPCSAYVSAGQPAWDDCCNGQLNVWLERPFFHENFPTPTSEAQVCRSFLAGDFAIQLVRCAPTVDDNGTPPSDAELADSARRIYQDFYIALRALTCCLAESRRDRLYLIRDSNIVGPDGGCVGFEIRVTIELHDPMPGM